MEYRTDTLREDDRFLAPNLITLLDRHVKRLAEDGWEPATITYCNAGKTTSEHYLIVLSRKGGA